MLGSLEGVLKANLEPLPSTGSISPSFSIQVDYLWQMLFRSWRNHTCMDGHPYELFHVPVRTSNYVIQKNKDMNGLFNFV